MMIFTAVMLLLVAIVTTLSNRVLNTSLTSALILTESGEVDYEASVYVPESISREERISALRTKIAEGGDLLSLAEPEEAEVVLEEAEVVEEEAATTTAPGVSKNEPQLCAGYSKYGGVWDTSGIKFAVSEGSRIIYKEKMALDGSDIPQRETVLQLPIYSVPSSGSSVCVPTDVVGVAQDGSLIRNNEVELYSVFGESTLVGYALDGFPIYGTTNKPTDACGGKIESGQYRYYLSGERATVLSCFAATPVNL